jgi:MerR family mercuric resistance operon transcriptional regulator
VRRYGAADVKRLRFIRSAQAAGFTLTEIKELLDLDASDDRARAREMARARVAALNEKIAQLEQARDALALLAKACASTGRGPCPIITAFDS